MLAQGLKSGDEAMVYGVFSQAERGQSEKGLADTLEKAGLKVDRLDITQEVNSDTSLGMPDPRRLHRAHPNLKAIGTQHGGVTGVMPQVLKKAGKKPGDIIVGGIDLAPATIDGLKSAQYQRDARPAALSAGLHPGRAVRDDRQVQDAGPVAQHRRGHRDAEDDRRAHQAHRRGHPLRLTAVERREYHGPRTPTGVRDAGEGRHLAAAPMLAPAT